MAEDFLILKEKILDCIDSLSINYQRCEDAGMKDTESILYNKIETLFDNLKVSNTKGALEEIIFLGKLIEKDMENWMVSIGQSTTSINWPDV